MVEHRLNAVGCSLEVPRIIQVWCVRISESDPEASQFAVVLSPDEMDRAARFRFDRSRRSFVVTRGVLRLLLGDYLHIVPRSVQFSYSANGKPILPGSDVKFSVSHSGDLALFAFTLKSEIGVDVEQIRPLHDMLEIANRFFSADEAAELMSVPVDQRQTAFFLCWTRKEAYIKATGEGLARSLADFRVNMRPGEEAQLLHIGHDAVAARAWSLHDLKLIDCYAGALAYRDKTRPVQLLSTIDSADLLGCTR